MSINKITLCNLKTVACNGRQFAYWGDRQLGEQTNSSVVALVMFFLLYVITSAYCDVGLILEIEDIFIDFRERERGCRTKELSGTKAKRTFDKNEGPNRSRTGDFGKVALVSCSPTLYH